MPNKRISPDTRFQPVVDFFFAEFERRHGCKPLWDGSDGSALGRILFSQKQLSAEQLMALVGSAFAWCDDWWGDVRKGDFCPLQPGFRFREFAAHFGKIVCHQKTPLKSPLVQGQRSHGGTSASRVTAQQIRAVFREYRYRMVGAQDPHAKWTAILMREVGVTYDEAAAILSREPMRPDRTGD